MKYFALPLTVLFCIAPFVVFAADPAVQSTGLLSPKCDDNAANDKSGLPPCTFNSVVATAQEIASAIVKLGLIVSPVIFAYAGYLLLMSGDKPGNRTKARDIAKNVVIGLAIMLAAWVIVNLVLTALVKQNVYQSVWGSGS